MKKSRQAFLIIACVSALVAGTVSVSTSTVPYVDVRVGTDEHPGGQNHMRIQLGVSPIGVIHMNYRVFGSSINNDLVPYFYNAYDCGGSNALRNGDTDIPLSQFYGIDPSRPRDLGTVGGMLNFTTGLNTMVAYANRFIRRTDLGPGQWDRRGFGIVKDGAECLGLITMDTAATSPYGDPVMYAVNESTRVCTLADQNDRTKVLFTFSTNRGITWTAPTTSPITNPYFNATDITGSNDCFYILSITDPSNPNALLSTERPCYIKGCYNSATGSTSFGPVTDITGLYSNCYLANMIDISGTMIADTLHVLWTDWNNFDGNAYGGPLGGRVVHAAVMPNGTVDGPHLVASINIDGREPGRSTTGIGLATGPWPFVSLSYSPSTDRLYALWSQPPDNGIFGFADSTDPAIAHFGNFDIFNSVSPNHGQAWDYPVNITQTNASNCDGTSIPCASEEHFKAYPRVVNDTIWILALVNAFPGYQTISSDPGPDTRLIDTWRLYKAPARAPALTINPYLSPCSDPWNVVQPGALSPLTVQKRLSNIGILGFLTDSIKIDAVFNDGFLVTTSNFSAGNPVPVGGGYNFDLSFNASAVTASSFGLREGLLEIYLHSTSPPTSRVIRHRITCYVVPTFHVNGKTTIHSGNNETVVGSQGSIDGGFANGLFYPSNGSGRIREGGVLIANSDLNASACASGPRKVTHQLYENKFLRCLSDASLDSVQAGSHWNLSLVSVATDLEDSTLVFKNIWEQCTHPDSSDFLIQTTKVINIGNGPIDSVAMGVLYDVNVTGQSGSSENVGGDTAVSYLGRTWQLGWIAGNDGAIDSCSPNNQMYGFVVIPGSIGNPGNTVGPRSAVIFQQRGFSNTINCGNPNGGDSLIQRYAWKLAGFHSTESPSDDSLTGVQGRCVSGNAYREDMGYLAVAKKVYNLGVNVGGGALVARYGLGGLVAGTDSAFKGVGETFTVIHLASNNGMSDLLLNAQKGIDWYVKHANQQAGSYQDVTLRGDFNNDHGLTASDAVVLLNKVYLGSYPSPSVGPFSDCVADVNLDGNITSADYVNVLNRIFLASGCPWCLTRCP